jgi:hypothetical protein
VKSEKVKNTKCKRGLLLTLGLTLPLNFGCDHQVTGADPTAAPSSAVTEATTIPAAARHETNSSNTPPQPVSARAPKATFPSQNQTVDSTFDDLKFDMEKMGDFDRSLLTARIEQLFGQKIRIRGYIYPTLRKRGLKQFVLVRDNLECCFGPGAALYDCILVQMQAGKTAEYTIRPVAVEGILRFEPFMDPEGKHLAIFRLDGEQVR